MPAYLEHSERELIKYNPKTMHSVLQKMIGWVAVLQILQSRIQQMGDKGMGRVKTHV